MSEAPDSTTDDVVDAPDIVQAILDQVTLRLAHFADTYDASDIYEHLLKRIAAFEQSLDEGHEVGVRLANFGAAATAHVRGLGFKDPNLIEFQCVLPDGQDVVLLQHISQLSFMLVALPPVKEEKPFRIGFRAPE